MPNWFSRFFGNNEKEEEKERQPLNGSDEKQTYTPKAVDTSFITSPVSSEESEKDKSVSSLTEREYEVFQYLLKGTTIKDTAAAMGVSYSTVNTHMNSVYRKLGVNSKAKLIVEYHEYL